LNEAEAAAVEGVPYLPIDCGLRPPPDAGGDAVYFTPW
jgi:hypothetical protein